MKLKSFGISDIGLSRENNEDVFTALPDVPFFILADGMGGHNAGEIAASLAVESMCTSIKSLPLEATVEDTCQFLRQAIANANKKVFEESLLNTKCSGMGTTLSCFIIVKNFLIYAHIGDSRLYRYRDTLEQLTEDHSLCNRFLSQDEHTPAQRNVITRAIGNLSTILPDIGVIPLLPQDLYMLCSDGLSDYTSENKMIRILSSPLQLEEMAGKLVKSALENGGNDNITLLLVKISGVKQK